MRAARLVHEGGSQHVERALALAAAQQQQAERGQQLRAVGAVLERRRICGRGGAQVAARGVQIGDL